MTIEVKQMIVKSTIIQGGQSKTRTELSAKDIEKLRQRLLADCREMITVNMEELRER